MSAASIFDSITEELIEATAVTDDLDTALMKIMKATGIKTGNVAALMFCGPMGDNWKTDTPAARGTSLGKWLMAEAMMAEARLTEQTMKPQKSYLERLKG